MVYVYLLVTEAPRTSPECARKINVVSLESEYQGGDQTRELRRERKAVLTTLFAHAQSNYSCPGYIEHCRQGITNTSGGMAITTEE